MGWDVENGGIPCRTKIVFWNGIDNSDFGGALNAFPISQGQLFLQRIACFRIAGNELGGCEALLPFTPPMIRVCKIQVSKEAPD
jgi:hypothetical protein